MAPPDHAKARDIDGEGREWFVLLLDQDVAREDLAAWEAWMEADPAHAAAYRRVVETWNLAGSAVASRPAADKLAEDRYDPVVPVGTWRMRRRGRLRLVALSTVAAALVAFAGYYGLSRGGGWRGEDSQLFTARAERLDVKLSDGSGVRLGGMTSLNVKFSGRTRLLEMPRGEVYFEVASDKARPFVVETPLGDITAVGTAFDIDVGKDIVTLHVTEGVVAVRAEARPRARWAASKSDGQVLRVVAGQKLQMEKVGARLRVSQHDAAFSPTWTEGRFEYRNEPLRLVLEDINRYSAQPVIIADAALGDMTFTGSLQVDDTTSWLSALPRAFPIEIQTDRQNQVVLKKK